jgi:hypothetical protein
MRIMKYMLPRAKEEANLCWFAGDNAITLATSLFQPERNEMGSTAAE